MYHRDRKIYVQFETPEPNNADKIWNCTILNNIKPPEKI